MKGIISLAISAILAGGLCGCSSEAYSSKEAISRGDVVPGMDHVYNLDKFDRFLTHLEDKKPDGIRITGYTDEGDPIYKDLKFDGNAIQYSYDNSNDKFGGRGKGKRTDTCTQVSKEDNAQGEIDYKLSGCTKNDPNMSYFLLRLQK